MPFDPFVRSAADVLAGLGITPISHHELNAYKKAQVAAHPASLLFRIRVPLFTGVLGVMIAGTLWFAAGFIMIVILASAEATMPLAFSIALGLFWSGVLMMVVGFGASVTLPFLKVRSPAYWTEYYGIDEVVPEPILALMRQAKAAYPRATFILGKLQQDTVVLDPYILVRVDCTEACLGIWDDRGVIRIAQSDASATLAD